MVQKAKPQFGPMDRVTYNENGDIATIMTDNVGGRTITQYENGHATVSQDLGKNDVVNFHNGYISSIVKYENDGHFSGKPIGRTTISYGPNGKILSSVHESRININERMGGGRGSRDMWVTTSKTTYHDNGKIATHTTYKQRHERINRPPQVQEGLSEHVQLMQLWQQDFEEQDHTTTVDSYIASIEQMDESGKLILSVQLQEQDQVNYHPTGRVASILRMNKEGKPQSLVSYDENGKIQNQTVYQDGKVISSTDYTDGKPTHNVQQGDENYQNIFDQAKKKVQDQVSQTQDTPVIAPSKQRD